MQLQENGPERLYYQKEYVKCFTARVLSCRQSPKGFLVTLERTGFYPEGGGQPCDTGTLGGAAVIDVQEKDGQILHLLTAPLEEGANVEGMIDWNRRLTLMQQHTGEHILSGIIHQRYSFENVGFHMGSDAVTVDFDGEIPAAELPEIERLTNQAIWENLPVQVAYPSPEQLEKLNYRSKKALSGQVRIVTIPGYDICACCGTHVRFTGEVGLVKILSCQKHKGGVRLTLLMGRRALAHYHQLLESVSGISALLSAKQAEVLGAVEQLLAETVSLRQQLARLRRDSFFRQLQGIEERETLCLLEPPGLTPVELRQFCIAACEKAKIAAVFSGNDETGYKYALGSGITDVRFVGKALNAALRGRGGGAPDLIQGSVAAGKEQIQRYFEALAETAGITQEGRQ